MIMRLTRAVSIICLVAAVLSASCRESPSGTIVFCAGDSLTEQGYPPYLKAALGRQGIRARVRNHGRSGNTSREYLAYLRKAREGLKEERPDIVLIELGTNDVRIDGDHVAKDEFERNLRDIVTVFRGFKARSGRTPEIFLSLIPPVPTGTASPFGPGSPGRVTAEINPAIEAVSRSLGTGLVDNFSLFAASPGLLPGVHPSSEGYKAMAENWAVAVAARSPRPGR
jgi:lysophospholipase L1-like esterase